MERTGLKNTNEYTYEEYFEKWYYFRRVYFLHGYIDFFQGDTLHNPNLDDKPKVCANGQSKWIRKFGDAIWYRVYDLYFSQVLDNSNLYTSEEFFSSLNSREVDNI